MEAIAKWDFVGTNANLLSFNKGDILKLITLKQEEPHWYLAELDQEIGLVSENMIELEPCDWYHENLKRSKAEKLFRNNSFMKFIIRTSPENILFLSYCHRLLDQKVWHFKITKVKQSFTFFVDPKGPKEFSSLNQLARFVEVNGFWSAMFWVPFKDAEKGQRRKKKSLWSPNM